MRSKNSTLREITPDHLRCGQWNCPSVFVKQNGSLVIIGSKLSKEDLVQIKHRISNEEFAIEITPEYLQNILNK